MAFTQVFVQPQLWTEFSFFAFGGEDGVVNESVAPGVIWKFKELRVHLSVIFASVEDLTLTIDAIQGTAYDTLFLSTAMQNVYDLHYFPPLSEGMLMLSDDVIVFNLSMASGVNIVGVNVLGWAVKG